MGSFQDHHSVQMQDCMYRGRTCSTTQEHLANIQPNWPKYRGDHKTRHSNIINYILLNYTITHQHLCNIRILVAAAPTTLSLECSYSKLAKICYKDRTNSWRKILRNFNF